MMSLMDKSIESTVTELDENGVTSENGVTIENGVISELNQNGFTSELQINDNGCNIILEDDVTIDLIEIRIIKPTELYENDVSTELIKNDITSTTVLSDNYVTNDLNHDDVTAICSSSTFNSIVIKTSLMYIGFACTGLVSSLSGATYVHLELLFQCDTSAVSFAVTLQSAGCLLGAFVSMIISKLSTAELKMSLFMFLTAVSVISATLYPSIYWFLAITVLQGCGQGGYNCVLQRPTDILLFCAVAQSYTIQLWTNHRLKNPVNLAIHALWCLFVSIGPLIFAPFLVDISGHRSANHITVSNISGSLGTYTTADHIYILASSNSNTSMYNVYADSTETLYNVTQVYNDMPDVSMVRYAFIALGLPPFIPALAFFFLHRMKSHSLPELSRSKPPVDHIVSETVISSDKIKTDKVFSFRSTRDKIIFFSLVFLFFIFYASVDIVPRGFLTIFTAKYLLWSTRRSTLINTVYNGSDFAGLLIGVPVSAVVRPRTFLSINMLIILVASFLLQFAEWFDGALVWLAVGLLGFGLSTTLGGMILWVSERLAISAGVMALITITTSAGGVLVPPLVGQLFDRYSPMWTVYLVLIFAVFDCIFYISLMCMRACRMHR